MCSLDAPVNIGMPARSVFALLVDCSSSMRADGKLERAKDAVRDLVASLPSAQHHQTKPTLQVYRFGPGAASNGDQTDTASPLRTNSAGEVFPGGRFPGHGGEDESDRLVTELTPYGTSDLYQALNRVISDVATAKAAIRDVGDTPICAAIFVLTDGLVKLSRETTEIEKIASNIREQLEKHQCSLCIFLAHESENAPAAVAERPEAEKRLKPLTCNEVAVYRTINAGVANFWRGLVNRFEATGHVNTSETRSALSVIADWRATQ